MADESRAGDDAIEVVPLGNGRYRVTAGGRRQVAWAAGPPHARWVFLDGQVHLIDARAGREDGGPGPVDEQIELASPMPATVAAVHVAAGQQVAQGDLLVMLEAMKMEVPIRAPRGGIVRAIRCTLRELVQPGIPLVELE